jgi:isopenicillin N synthase-like dioxygenase
MKISITNLKSATFDDPMKGGLANQFRNRLDVLGCFLVTGCFEPRFIDAVHSAQERLFSVSDSVKASCKVDKQSDPLAEGFSPYGAAHALDTGIANLLETWDISTSRNNWPNHLSNEWQLLIDYQRQLYNVAVVALELIAVALEIKAEELLSLIRPENGGIHLIHYFPLTKEFPNMARR